MRLLHFVAVMIGIVSGTNARSFNFTLSAITMDLVGNPLNNTALKKNGSGSDLGLFFTKPDAVKNFPLALTTNPYPENEELWQYEGEVFEMDTGFRLVYIADPKQDEHAKKANVIGSLNLLSVDDIPNPTPKGWSYDRWGFTDVDIDNAGWALAIHKDTFFSITNTTKSIKYVGWYLEGFKWCNEHWCDVWELYPCDDEHPYCQDETLHGGDAWWIGTGDHTPAKSQSI